MQKSHIDGAKKKKNDEESKKVEILTKSERQTIQLVEECVFTAHATVSLESKCYQSISE